MNQTNKNIEIKVPFFIPVIIIVMFILVSRIYGLTTNNKVEAVEIIEDVAEEQDVMQDKEIIEEDVQQNQDESTIEENNEEVQEQVAEEQPKTVTYTASNGKSYDIIARISIPSLKIEYPILSTTSEELLRVAPNKYWGANPNEVGNMCIIGHNYENTKFFSKLPNIKIGDVVKITDLDGQTLDYTVYETDIIDPYDNSCTSQLTEGHTEITLITCYNKGAQRFIAKARAN